MLSLGAALLALASPGLTTRRTAALLLCACGAWGAALGGNAVMLFAGVEAANVGSLLLMSDGPRLGRGARLAFAAQHLSALGLLGAAVELTVGAGTSDLAAVPAGAVTAAVGLPWALCGVIRLVMPAVAPGRPGGDWAATAAVPAGAAVLMRLRSFSGPLPVEVIVVLAVTGALIAVWGMYTALRSSGDTPTAGRGLLLVGAGLPVAVVGMNADAAGLAAAAGLLALEASVAMAPLWTRPEGRSNGAVAAISIAIAGNIPIGFGAGASVLVLGAAASAGLVASPLVVALGASVAAGAAVAVRTALAIRGGRSRRSTAGLLPLAALSASLLAAVVPGAVAVLALAPLAGLPGSAPDAASLRGLQGGWAGGYYLVAAAWVAAVVWAGCTLAGVSLTRPERRARPRPARRSWTVMLAPWRRGRRPLRRALEAVTALDAWLVSQPRLPMVVVAAAVAVVFLH
jgi:hypothetical protein